MTKEEELIKYLKTTSPEQVMTDILHGKKPKESDLALINSIRKNTKLPEEVIGFLIQYVMLKFEKPTNAFVVRIAKEWSAKRITTAKAALEIAKKEHPKYKSQQQPVKSSAMNREQLNAKVLQLIEMYHAGNRKEYALGGLETLSDLLGVDLLRKYGIKSDYATD